MVGLQEPRSESERKEVETPDGMRRAIFKASRDSALIRHVEDMARIRGLSGEDKYVYLAYYALVQLERMNEMNLKFLNSHPYPGVLLSPSETDAQT